MRTARLAARGLGLALCVVLSPPVRSARADEAPKTAGVEVPSPKRTKFTLPGYPPEAVAKGLRGIVILEIVIDTNGKVASATVVRSVPPFDDAALAAVRQWEYEVTRVDGRAVPVRLTVPITFALRLPEMTRQAGIPELRQGASPRFPDAATTDRGRAVAQVKLDPDGQVVDALITAGDSPFAEALLQALASWRFAPPGSGTVLSFQVEAEFVRSTGTAPRVSLNLDGLVRSEAPAAAAAAPAPGAAAPAPPAPAAAPPAPVAAPPATASPAPAAPSAPEPAPSAPPSPPPAAASATPEPAAPPEAAPATEVLRAPAPPPTPAPPSPELGLTGSSAVPDVALSLGVPDLARGRRPAVPPFARIGGVTGTVSVRFSVSAAGDTNVDSVEGPEVLRFAARDTVASWVFRRLSAERLWLAAELTYGSAGARASVARQHPPEQP